MDKYVEQVMREVREHVQAPDINFPNLDPGKTRGQRYNNYAMSTNYPLGHQAADPHGMDRARQHTRPSRYSAMERVKSYKEKYGMSTSNRGRTKRRMRFRVNAMSGLPGLDRSPYVESDMLVVQDIEEFFRSNPHYRIIEPPTNKEPLKDHLVVEDTNGFYKLTVRPRHLNSSLNILDESHPAVQIAFKHQQDKKALREHAVRIRETLANALAIRANRGRSITKDTEVEYRLDESIQESQNYSKPFYDLLNRALDLKSKLVAMHGPNESTEQVDQVGDYTNMVSRVISDLLADDGEITLDEYEDMYDELAYLYERLQMQVSKSMVTRRGKNLPTLPEDHIMESKAEKAAEKMAKKAGKKPGTPEFKKLVKKFKKNMKEAIEDLEEEKLHEGFYYVAYDNGSGRTFARRLFFTKDNAEGFANSLRAQVSGKVEVVDAQSWTNLSEPTTAPSSATTTREVDHVIPPPPSPQKKGLVYGKDPLQK